MISMNFSRTKNLRTQRKQQNLRQTFSETTVLNEEESNFESFSTEELANTLKYFYAEATKKDGEFYKKSSLNCMREGLARYLKKERKINIIEDPEFDSANEIFRAQLVQLKRQGKGGTEHKEPVEENDLKKLYSNCDVSTPKGLQQKVWLDIMIYLIRHGRENLRQMTKTTFADKVDAAGNRYVTQTVDEMDKNHRENCDRDATIGEGRMYENPQSIHCPVKTFEMYTSKLYPDLDALWQRPREGHLTENDKIWYCNSPVGEKKLGNMMKDMSAEYKLSKLYTNHCIRSTAIQILNLAGNNDREIMKISGHKSVTSLQSYDRITEKCQQSISQTIGNAVTKVGTQEASKPRDKSMDHTMMLRQPIFLYSHFVLKNLCHFSLTRFH